MAKTKSVDPLDYIEGSFLDRSSAKDVKNGKAGRIKGTKPKGRFRRTKLSAPRPRMQSAKDGSEVAAIDPELAEMMANLPKNLEFLAKFFDDEVTSHYYSREFGESRQELIRKLVDPELSLEQVSRLLGVCPATVRRYTNRGWLEHHRTKGGQRRFRLSSVAKHVQEHGRLPES